MGIGYSLAKTNNHNNINGRVDVHGPTLAPQALSPQFQFAAMREKGPEHKYVIKKKGFMMDATMKHAG